MKKMIKSPLFMSKIITRISISSIEPMKSLRNLKKVSLKATKQKKDLKNYFRKSQIQP